MGKIDIISVTENSLYLIEAKRASTKESLLKTILEIYTYFKQAVQNKQFKETFGNGKKIFKPAILLFKGSMPANEISSMNEDLRYLLELLEKDINSKIHFFIVEPIKIKNCNRRVVLFDKKKPKIQPINLMKLTAHHVPHQIGGSCVRKGRNRNLSVFQKHISG